MSCSILINNYNNGPYLKACLESVLEQLSREDEIIVYDDGSTDNSREILRQYEERVRTIFAPKILLSYRKCQATAIYRAFSVSRGELIFLLDGDDIFLPGKLEAYRKAFISPDVTMVQSKMLHMNREGKIVGEKWHPWAHNIDTREQVNATQDLDFFYATSALALTRKVLEAELPLALDAFPAISSDIALSIAALLRGRVVTLDKAYTAWRQHGSNRSDRFKGLFHRLKFDLELARYHNLLASRLGEKSKINPWRNQKLYRRTARHIAQDILRLR